MLAMTIVVLVFLSTQGVNAHIACFCLGMFCKNGPQLADDPNSNAIVHPLWDLPYNNGYWLHSFDQCDQYPPPEGEFLELPAGGNFTVELATNRAKTTLSYNGTYTSQWPDGGDYPSDYNVPTCITSPNMHTQNQSMAAGTAFAISYNSDITDVTPNNSVVFSIVANSPWYRETTYQVPANMPACPPGGCICIWSWVPNGCGEPNMYFVPIRCNVTNVNSPKVIGTPQPPVWCQDDPANCVSGPKQLIVWNQAEGNNIVVEGYDLSGSPKSPGYNSKCGWADGAQNDIFENSPSSGPTPSSSSSSSSGTPTHPPTSSNTISPNTLIKSSTNDTSKLCKKSTPETKRSSLVRRISSHLKRRRARQTIN